MKFSPSVLLEIVHIVQRGLSEGIDVSEQLRKIDVQQDPGDPDKVTLTPAYILLRDSNTKA